MQISKAWLSGVIAYLLGQAALKWGFTFGDDLADQIANFIIVVIIPLIIAFMNRKKGDTNAKRPTDTGSAV